MAGNTIGQIFRVTTFGESHGEMIGVVIDGCPAGLELDTGFVQAQLDRRRPGQSKITTQRKEQDQVRFVSGVFEGRTTGAPLAAYIPNEDARAKDYADIAGKWRPSHADFTYDAKFGLRDPRGGGRSSARETAARVIAGAVAQLFLRAQGVSIQAFVSQAGTVSTPRGYAELDLSKIDSNIVRCPDEQAAAKMIEAIEGARKAGDTLGGVVSCVIRGCPAGLGEPVFDRLHADLGKAMLSINAAKGFEYGSGFAGTLMRGSEHNDPFIQRDGKVATAKNDSGGIQGGISNGMEIYFNVAFKPVATLMKKQATLDRQGNPTEIEGHGRHDPCVVPRAVPIVEAMAGITLADHLLRSRCARV